MAVAVAVFPMRVIVVFFVGMVVAVVVFFVRVAVAVVMRFVGVAVAVTSSSEMTDQKPCP